MPEDRIELYKDKKDEWRWRYVVINGGDILADSGEGYHNKGDAVFAAQRVTARVLVYDTKDMALGCIHAVEVEK